MQQGWHGFKASLGQRETQLPADGLDTLPSLYASTIGKAVLLRPLHKRESGDRGRESSRGS